MDVPKHFQGMLFNQIYLTVFFIENFVMNYNNQQNPAGTKHLYNVAWTSMQRHDVALTLRWRSINALC